jgi:hypothetical protein
MWVTRMKSVALARSLVFVLLLVFGVKTVRAEDVIIGKVIAPDSQGIKGASITVTPTNSTVRRTAQTDSVGGFKVVFPERHLAYTIRATAPGFTPQTTRTSRGQGDTIHVTIALARAVQRLGSITTETTRPLPTRAVLVADSTATETSVNLGFALHRISLDMATNLAALVASVTPNALIVPGGISVLGLTPSQNSTVLNGLAFAGATVPRGALGSTVFTTSSYDPANGWFSGGRTNFQLTPGERFTRSSAYFTLDAPALQSTDPVSTNMGQRFTHFFGSFGSSGNILNDRFSYNYGIDAGRKSADASSLLSAGADVLQNAGVSSDSVVRLVQLLEGASIPTRGGAPQSVLTDNATFLGRIDYAPYDWNTLTAAKTSWGLTGYANVARNQAQGLGLTGTPAHGGKSLQSILSLAGEYSAFFGNDFLASVRSSFSHVRNASDPYLQLPDGRVLVASNFSDGTGGVTPLAFGGNSALHNDLRNWTWENTLEMKLYPVAFVRHRFKIDANVRYDGFSHELFANQLGTYFYNSLADLQANRPASFTRTLDTPTRTGGEWNAFASLGDQWRVTPSFQLRYGLRVEGNVYGSVPTYNPAVEQAFGVRTDHAPNTFAVIPRAGFQWTVPAWGKNPMGRPTRPVGTIRGGVGLFRNILDPTLLSNASIATGLPTGARRLLCLGSAVPTADWEQFAVDASAIPDACAGSNGAVFSDAAPEVHLFDKSFTAQRSWRGALAYASSAFGNAWSIEGVYSRNLNQHSAMDLNFSGVQRFTLPEEGRPMYVDASSIVTSSGAVSPVQARKTDAFGRVVSGVSDLRSTSKQLIFTVRPWLPGALGNWVFHPEVSYVRSNTRAQERGFAGTTFGDPAIESWGRSNVDVKHMYSIGSMVMLKRGRYPVYMSFFSQLRSGAPFTPIVGSDINGDGLVNDRAFIADPSSMPATTGQAFTALLNSSSSKVRKCLNNQLGQAAGRGSCEGPWTSTMLANLVYGGENGTAIPRVRQITLNLSNPLGGLDQLLHGSDKLRGWGTPAMPDPTLFTVEGFDAATNRFLYRVNPRFGSTSPAFSTLRAPFRATIDVRVDVGKPQSRQQIDRWLRAGRNGQPGQRLTAAELKKRYARSIPDIFGELLVQSDSLILTPEQTEEIRKLQSRHVAHMDSVWGALAEYLAALPDRFDGGAVFDRIEKDTDEGWEYSRLMVKNELPKILRREQLIILGGTPARLYNAPGPVHIRIFLN